jgi:hypothetical protein
MRNLFIHSSWLVACSVTRRFVKKRLVFFPNIAQTTIQGFLPKKMLVEIWDFKDKKGIIEILRKNFPKR